MISVYPSLVGHNGRHAYPLGRVGSEDGAALIEFVIVAFLLFTLVFGIIEFSMLMRSYQAVSHAAREGARTAALGSPRRTVEARVNDAATGITLSETQITYAPAPATGTPATWSAWPDDASLSSNTVPSGDLIKVQVSCQYNWVTGFFGSSPKTLTSSMVMRRE